MAREAKEHQQKREPRENREPRDQQQDAFQDRVIQIARVAKVVKGGRRFSFAALVVVGDGKDQVGFGHSKAGEVPDAIRKASEQAKKELYKIPSVNGTIPFEVVGRFGSAKVVMFPAPKGKGIIAGGAVRTIVELAGITDIVCKVHGTKNSQNVVRATIDGLMQLIPLQEYSKRRGFDPSEVQQERHPKNANQAAAKGEPTKADKK